VLSSLRKLESGGVNFYFLCVFIFWASLVYGGPHNSELTQKTPSQEQEGSLDSNGTFEDGLRDMTNEQLGNLAKSIINEKRLSPEVFSNLLKEHNVDSRISNNLSALYQNMFSQLGAEGARKKALEDIYKIIEKKLLEGENDGDLFSLYQYLSKLLNENNNNGESEFEKLFKQKVDDLNKKLNDLIQAKNDDHKKDDLKPLKDLLDKLGEKGDSEPSGGGEESGGGGGDQGGGQQGGGGSTMNDSGASKPSSAGSRSPNTKQPETKLPKNASKKKNEPKKDNNKGSSLEPKKDSSEEPKEDKKSPENKGDLKGLDNIPTKDEPREIIKEAQQLIPIGDKALNRTLNSTQSGSTSLNNFSIPEKEKTFLGGSDGGVFNVGYIKPFVPPRERYPYTRTLDSDFAQANGELSDGSSSYIGSTSTVTNAKNKNNTIIQDIGKKSANENHGIFSKRILKTVCENNPNVGICDKMQKNKLFSLGSL